LDQALPVATELPADASELVTLRRKRAEQNAKRVAHQNKVAEEVAKSREVQEAMARARDEMHEQRLLLRKQQQQIDTQQRQLKAAAANLQHQKRIADKRAAQQERAEQKQREAEAQDLRNEARFAEQRKAELALKAAEGRKRDDKIAKAAERIADEYETLVDDCRRSAFVRDFKAQSVVKARTASTRERVALSRKKEAAIDAKQTRLDARKERADNRLLAELNRQNEAVAAARERLVAEQTKRGGEMGAEQRAAYENMVEQERQRVERHLEARRKRDQRSEDAMRDYSERREDDHEERALRHEQGLERVERAQRQQEWRRAELSRQYEVEDAQYKLQKRILEQMQEASRSCNLDRQASREGRGSESAKREQETIPGPAAYNAAHSGCGSDATFGLSSQPKFSMSSGARLPGQGLLGPTLESTPGPVTAPMGMGSTGGTLDHSSACTRAPRYSIGLRKELQIDSKAKDKMVTPGAAGAELVDQLRASRCLSSTGSSFGPPKGPPSVARLARSKTLPVLLSDSHPSRRPGPTTYETRACARDPCKFGTTLDRRTVVNRFSKTDRFNNFGGIA